MPRSGISRSGKKSWNCLAFLFCPFLAFKHRFLISWSVFVFWYPEVCFVRKPGNFCSCVGYSLLKCRFTHRSGISEKHSPTAFILNRQFCSVSYTHKSCRITTMHFEFQVQGFVSDRTENRTGLWRQICECSACWEWKKIMSHHNDAFSVRSAGVCVCMNRVRLWSQSCGDWSC